MSTTNATIALALIKGVLLSIILSLASLSQIHAAPNMAFRHVLQDQLESIGYVNAVVQDSMGFMWFGGNNGLARYDGYTLVIYRNALGDPYSLSNNYINDLHVSRKGVLWVGTEKGLNRYNANTDQFTVFKQPSGSSAAIATNDVRAILEDQQGRLWLGTRGGLHLFLEESNEFTRFYYEEYPRNTGTSLIWTLAEDSKGYIWIGNQTGGLSRFDPRSSSFKHFRSLPEDPESLSHNEVRSIYVDSKDNLWIGTYGGGINKMDASRSGFKRYQYDPKLKTETVWAAIEDQTGRIWVGDGGGLLLLNKETDTFTRFQHQEGEPRSLGNHVVTELFLDRAGDLWVGFFPSGVDVVDGQASVFRNFIHNPKTPNSIADGGLLAAHQDKKGDLWLGAGYGLSHYDMDRQFFRTYRHDPANPGTLSGDTVLSIVGDPSGAMWLGIWGSGLNYFNPDTGEFRYFFPVADDSKTLRGKEPWAMTLGKDGFLWIITEEGLNRLNRNTGEVTFYVPQSGQVDGEQRLYGRAILEDSKGTLWIGANRGLYRFDRDASEFKRYQSNVTDRDSLSENTVRSLYEDGKGILWIGTEGGGLNRMNVDTETFSAIRSKDGLPDEVITSIEEDNEGQLWLGTHKGLVRYDPETGDIRSYDRRHGLPGNLFNRNASTKLQDGSLAFGSSKGLTLFEPKDLWVNDYVPPVVITEFSIFNKPLSVGGALSPLAKAPWKLKEIELEHDQSIFSISFAALNYRSPEENEYAYMLAGFDEDWHYVGKKRVASYTNIDPGSYVFRVKGANNEGIWNDDVTEVVIHIRPPLWQTWWAYAVYLMLLAAVIYLVIHVNFRKQAYDREHVLNQRLKDLDKLKDEFLANTSHELRTPLNGIIGLSESLLDGAAGPVPNDIKKYIEMISFSGKRLANLVNDILDFSKLKNHTLQLNRKPIELKAFVQTMMNMTQPLVGTKPIELVNLVPVDLPPIDADENRMQQILYNLLGNAIKFTDKGSVTVSASRESDFVIMDVSDTGIGIPPDQVNKIFESFEQVDGTSNRSHGGTGLGLAITKRLIELHGGTITVSSKLEFGSTFRLKLPAAKPSHALSRHT